MAKDGDTILGLGVRAGNNLNKILLVMNFSKKQIYT